MYWDICENDIKKKSQCQDKAYAIGKKKKNEKKKQSLLVTIVQGLCIIIIILTTQSTLQ